MINLIVSINFWRKTENRKLGIAAIVVSVISSLIAFLVYGAYGLIDAAVAVANIIIFLKTQPNDDMFY